MKKLSLAFLAGAMALSVAACGSDTRTRNAAEDVTTTEAAGDDAPTTTKPALPSEDDTPTTTAAEQEQPRAASVTAQCAGDSTLGLVQSITQGGEVKFMKLDLVTGDYVDIPGAAITLADYGIDAFNAAGTDPITGKSFAMVQVGNSEYLVEFDTTGNLRFVGEMPAWSVAGTVTPNGDYAYVNAAGSISIVSGVGSLATFANAGNSPTLSVSGLGPAPGDARHGVDIAYVVTGDGKPALVSYDSVSDSGKIVVTHLDGSGSWSADYNSVDGRFTSEVGNGDGVGAIYASGGNLYLSRNDGSGIFAIIGDDLVQGQSVDIFSTSIDSTTQTNKNDGFGCPTAEDIPDVFAPDLSLSSTCSNGGEYTVTVDNSDSTVDGTLTISNNGATATVTVAAGDSYTFTGSVSPGNLVTAQFSAEGFQTETAQTRPTGCTPPVDPVNCATNPTGFLQTVNNGDGTASILEIDLETGVWSDTGIVLDFTQFSPNFSDYQLNATALDPVTGLMMGILNPPGSDPDSMSFLVSFDQNGDIALHGTITGTEYPNTTLYAGAFLSDGTLVALGINGFATIPNAGSLQGYGSVGEVQLGLGTNTGSGFEIGDIALMNDANGDEILVGYNTSTQSFVAWPTDDLANPVTLTTTLPDSYDTSLSPKPLGAAWSHPGTGAAYFSSNNGQGVWALFPSNVDMQAATATLSPTSIDSSTPSASNDGLGCSNDVPDVFDPDVDVSVACSTGYEGSYVVTVSNEASNVAGTLTLNVGGVISTLSIEPGETQTLTGSVANGATVTATFSHPDFESKTDSATLTGCVEPEVFEPVIDVTAECSTDGNYTPSGGYTIDNSGSNVELTYTVFVNGTQTATGTVAAGDTLTDTAVIVNGDTLKVVVGDTDGNFDTESASASLTGCVAPDVWEPTVVINMVCGDDGVITWTATVDNSQSTVDAGVAITIDGEAVTLATATVAGGSGTTTETQTYTGTITEGQVIVVTASSDNQTDETATATAGACVEATVFTPNVSLSTQCSAAGVGSYSVTVDNSTSNSDATVSIVIGEETVTGTATAGESETWTGSLANGATVTVTASFGGIEYTYSTTLTDCTPPPTTTTTTPPTTTEPPATTTTAPDLPTTGSGSASTSGLALTAFAIAFAGFAGLIFGTRRRMNNG